jgi:BirA family biotin operon repressor/biotin-[acetyl-CoA-carboxylase] ligase
MHPVGSPFVVLQSEDSTNNYAMRLAHEGLAQHGAAVFTHHQTAGKGQRSKQWLAPPGQNILMSVVLEPGRVVPTPPFTFSMAMALAAHGLLKKWVDNVKIKWPNDLFIGDRKAGGILIENSMGPDGWKVAVVGMGLNINQTRFGDLQGKATSLQQLTGKSYDPVALAKDLCAEIEAAFAHWQQNPDAIAVQYHQHLYKKGERVQLKQGARLFEAVVKGVNNWGQLVTQHAVEECFDVGAVAWLLP